MATNKNDRTSDAWIDSLVLLARDATRGVVNVTKSGGAQPWSVHTDLGSEHRLTRLEAAGFLRAMIARARWCAHAAPKVEGGAK